MANNKTYLGDSVYVEFQSGMIKLTTENGYGPSNTIFLEERVYENLIAWVAAVPAVNEDA